MLPDGAGRIPTSGSAVWHLPDGDFTYVRGAFDPESVTFEYGRSGSDTGPSAPITEEDGGGDGA